MHQTECFGFPIVRQPPRRRTVTAEELAARDLYAATGSRVKRLVNAVGEHFAVEPWRLFVRRRYAGTVRIRAVAMKLLLDHFSPKHVGHFFGGFDRKSVINAARIASEEMPDDVTAIRNLLERRP